MRRKINGRSSIKKVHNNETKEDKGAKECLYDKIPLTLKQLDIIIAVMIALFIIFFVIGVLKGK